jgi:hypothetical protein
MGISKECLPSRTICEAIVSMLFRFEYLYETEEQHPVASSALQGFDNCLRKNIKLTSLKRFDVPQSAGKMMLVARQDKP